MKKSLNDISILPEILLVDKPKGISSFSVIRILQRKFGKQKIGHAGTLDPLATGLLILGVGQGTKKLSELLADEKVYITDIVLGKSTTTGDAEGSIVKTQEYPDLKKDAVEDAVESLRNVSELPVSLYSALKKDGVPLYEYARKGIEMEEPIKPMKVLEVAMLDHYKKEPFEIVRVRFRVSKGTYIRSLGEELGRRLGVPASLQTLQRTKVGEFSLEDAYTVPTEWVEEYRAKKTPK